MEYSVYIISYLLGSVPFGLLIAQLIAKTDIRQHGSGNIGATNITRILGKKLGAIVLILDALKGVAAVILARMWGFDGSVVIICAALAVFGHIFPIWLKFRGGKGVATGLAVLVALYYPFGVGIITLWIIAYIIFRISALAALIAFSAAPFMAYFFFPPLIWLCIFLSIIVIIRHIDNIKRLISGVEK